MLLNAGLCAKRVLLSLVVSDVSKQVKCAEAYGGFETPIMGFQTSRSGL